MRFVFIILSRIEDKLDARNLYSISFSIRMECAPATKRVPLQFPAWIVYHEDTITDNCFHGCQLANDRHGCLWALSPSKHTNMFPPTDSCPWRQVHQRPYSVGSREQLRDPCL